MEKSFLGFLGMWWRQPSDFNWTIAHLRARGVVRIHRVVIGVFTMLCGVGALLMVVAGWRGNVVVIHSPIVLAVAASAFVVGPVWIWGPLPTLRWTGAFVFYADISVVAVVASYASSFTAMPGLALLAVNGIFVVSLHGPKALALHLGFSVAAYAGFFVASVVQRDVSSMLIVLRFLVLAPVTIGIPVLMQSYLLALRADAVDALHDPLTRLLNRRGLQRRIVEMGGSASRNVGVLTIDVDKFKAINDAHGHDVGDRVLVAVANAAHDAVAEAGVRATIARVGGEEFVVVVDGVPATAQRVASLLHQAVAGCGQAVTPTVSIGLASTSEVVGPLSDTLRPLIERSDAAMYRAKSAGGNRTVSVD